MSCLRLSVCHHDVASLRSGLGAALVPRYLVKPQLYQCLPPPPSLVFPFFCAYPAVIFRTLPIGPCSVISDNERHFCEKRLANRQDVARASVAAAKLAALRPSPACSLVPPGPCVFSAVYDPLFALNLFFRAFLLLVRPPACLPSLLLLHLASQSLCVP